MSRKGAKQIQERREGVMWRMFFRYKGREEEELPLDLNYRVVNMIGLEYGEIHANGDQMSYSVGGAYIEMGPPETIVHFNFAEIEYIRFEEVMGHPKGETDND